jgi:ATP-binding cassette subfamily B protein
VKFFAKTTESLRELSNVIKHVLSDAWRDNKAKLLIVVLMTALLASLPYAERGVQALMLNRLVRLYGTHNFDAILVSLVVAAAVIYFLRDAGRSSIQYFRRLVWFGRRTNYELAYGAKLVSLDTATHEDPKFQDQLQVLQEYGGSLAAADFFESLVDNAENVIGFGSAFIIVCIADWRLAFLILVFATPQFFVELRYGKGVWDAYESKSADRRLYMELRRHTQTAQGVREIQTFQSVPYFVRRLRDSLEQYYSALLKEDRKKIGMQIVCQLVLAGGIVWALVVLISQVLSGTMEIGTFTFVLAAVTSLDGTATSFLMRLADQRRSARTVNSFFNVMEREPIIKSPELGGVLSNERAPRIEFRNVSFAYPGRPESEVLKDFSLTIESGERIALVGVNGAGKSTLIKLLCRFYDPTEGAILLDGVDLRDIDLASWYRHLALLAQDFETYHLKTSELISLGRSDEEVTLQRVSRAAERSGSSSFIERWPKRYDQQIGTQFTGGIDPSGGQKQKLALARALYRDALVSILDEPTAHVDAGAEQEIFEGLESELKPEQTLILISHRFSTVRTADRICVIKDGAVLEVGSHTELIAIEGGTYADLFRNQAEGYQ